MVVLGTMTSHVRLACEVCGADDEYSTDRSFLICPMKLADDNVSVYAEEFVSRHADSN